MTRSAEDAQAPTDEPTRPARRWLRRAAALAVLGFIAVNVVAWLQAGSMTTWGTGESRTEKPEDLGPLAKLGVVLKGVSIPRPTNAASPTQIGQEFETLRFESESGSELEAWHLRVESSDTTAILFHGYSSSKDTMLNVAAGLVELDCSVLMVDFYGSGGSSGTGTSLGMHEAYDVAAAVEECQTRWPGQQILLYGQSMGGAAILRASARLEVQPDAIVIESTFDRLASTVASRFHRMNLPSTPLSQMLLFWGSVRLRGNGFGHNPVEDAASVLCPTLVFQGEADPNVSLDQARGLVEALGGWSRFQPVVKTGHQDIRGSAPELWSAELRGLLERIRAADNG